MESPACDSVATDLCSSHTIAVCHMSYAGACGALPRIVSMANRTLLYVSMCQERCVTYVILGPTTAPTTYKLQTGINLWFLCYRANLCVKCCVTSSQEAVARDL